MKKSDTAITPTRNENFPQWYLEVIKAADLAENSAVRGSMIIKPNGYSIWEHMQSVFDGMIKTLGVRNAYFPLLIPLEFISREAEHIDGFAKECAVVTHHRLEQDPDGGGLIPAGKLEKPYVIRPTSETIIGDSMSRWIQSYRDLPMKLNQWCNVMRWEMRPRLFLRTSEFLWQEGHNAFETADEAREDQLKMLNSYTTFIEDFLAIPVIRGEKTKNERFPGAVSTLTVEAMMQDGKALQAGTSHNLGQTFSKSCEIKYKGRDGIEYFAHTTSWGISTRLIGAIVMTHGDDNGLIIPPRIAPKQVVIIPIIHSDIDRAKLLRYATEIKAQLTSVGVRVQIDESDLRTSDRIWSSIKQGTPIRIEVGTREFSKGELTYVRRDIGKESKKNCSLAEFVEKAPAILEAIHDNLINLAKLRMEERIVDVDSVMALRELFEKDHVGFARANTELLADDNLIEVMNKFSLTERCMPLVENGKKVIIGKAY